MLEEITSYHKSAMIYSLQLFTLVRTFQNSRRLPSLSNLTLKVLHQHLTGPKHLPDPFVNFMQIVAEQGI